MKIVFRKLVVEDSKNYRSIRLESLKLNPNSFETTYEEQEKLKKLMFEEALENDADDRFVVGELELEPDFDD